MLEILEEALIDSIKLVPFLFMTYLIMEYIEHKTSKKSKEAIKKSGKFGPAIRKHFRHISTMWIFCFCDQSLCS